ncbi:protein penguin [Phymastichus coffea]|uniref:protein penguin n=1 Tax=Phymastichus coffea TaxID=108790 RepID=UPI00273AD52E|nr:protein penguin [Phymastichus coffea]
MKRKSDSSEGSTKTKKSKVSKKLVKPAKNTKRPSTHKSKDKKKLKAPQYEKSRLKNDGSFKQKNAKFSSNRQPNLDKKKYLKKNDKNTDSTGEKPDWVEYKKQQKELRNQRRAKKLNDSYEIALQLKQIGEKLRRSDLPKETQENLTKKMHGIAQKHYAKMIFAHDLSRVIQWQIKYCSEDIRFAIVEELKPHLQKMFSSIYAKNVIKTLLKCGSSKVKNILMQTCMGNAVKLVSNNVSASLFEKVYVEIVSKSEQNLFKQEFYGDMFKKSKDPNIQTLTDVYTDSEGMKTATLSAVKACLVKILNKQLINSTLVHTLLYEYLTNCSKTDRAEIIVMVRPLITELSQTKDGAKAGNLCIWHGTNKDRKFIMKALKDHVKSIVMSEHGHLMIMALLDSVDDTVLLKKILLQEMLNNLDEIVVNEYGKRVILYIVARRDTHYFHPALVEYLKTGDNNETSKKPAEIREKELLDNVIHTFLESIANNANVWLSSNSVQMVTFAILKASQANKPEAAFDAIAKFLINSDSKITVGTKTFEAIEEPGLHMIIKKLIRMDPERLESNGVTFGETLHKYLTDEILSHWINNNRACFLLVSLIANESEKVVSNLKFRLKKLKNLKTNKTKGATVLLEKLD